jgi:hypothetical protein
MVREQALVTDQGRKTVYVVKEKKDEQGQPVKDKDGKPVYLSMVRDVGNVGVLRDGYREVEKGVEPGDWVVVAGMQRLRPGGEVKTEKYSDVAEKKTAEKGNAETKGSAPGHEPAKDTAAAKLTPAGPGGGNPPQSSTNTTTPPAPTDAAKAEDAGTGDSWRRSPRAPADKGAGRIRQGSGPTGKGH